MQTNLTMFHFYSWGPKNRGHMNECNKLIKITDISFSPPPPPSPEIINDFLKRRQLQYEAMIKQQEFINNVRANRRR
jgi:hypothetical protein